MANTYVLIASNTLTSSAASVTFSSIPGTYTDLVLKYSARSDNSGSAFSSQSVTFNSDTGTNYSLTRLQGYATNSAYSDRLSPANAVTYFLVPGATATSSTFSNTELYIPNYQASANKPISVSNVLENNSSSTFWVQALAELWRSSSSITSITITDTANFVSGSSFWLYGIKKY